MSHNHTDNGKDKGRLRFPFPYFVLNRIWCTLIDQPKWKAKTPEALQIAISLLKEYSPPIAVQMMEYSISNGYKDVYPPKQHMIDLGNSKLTKFLEEEKQLRLPRIRAMLLQLADAAPKELQPYMPGENQCAIKLGEFNITCPSAVSDWIESNGEQTFKIILQATLGLKLMYNKTT